MSNLQRKLSFMALLVPLIFIFDSADSANEYAFPIAGCVTHYAHSHHDYPATDILTKVGCHFVAPTSGVVDEVNRIDRWSGKTNKGADRGGLYISIVGDDGVRYYGSHLRKIAFNLQAGDRVSAGDLLGEVGTTGDARGTSPHLHFGISWPTKPGIWWVRRGEVYPWRYLDQWKKGISVSPARAVEKLRQKIGTVPLAPRK